MLLMCFFARQKLWNLESRKIDTKWTNITPHSSYRYEELVISRHPTSDLLTTATSNQRTESDEEEREQDVIPCSCGRIIVVNIIVCRIFAKYE
eukprot:scaffold62636_cov52-Attheya_sp.AAC.2